MIAIAVLACVIVAICATGLPDQGPAIARAADLSGVIDRQDIVFAVQQDLALQGFDPGPMDGIAGGLTKTAIHAYRSRIGVPGEDRVTRDLLVLLGEGH